MILTTSHFTWRSSFFSVGLLVATSLVGLPERAAGQSILEQERQRRATDSQEAYGLLKTGDEAYKEADYAKAVKDYARARELLVKAPKTEVIRASATQRYAQAAVEEGKRLAKIGEYQEARDLIDGVLLRDVAPGDIEAQRFRKQLDDPIRYNQALTKDHMKNVDRVRRTLYEAEGFYNLGQYDRAVKMYEDVLRIDPYNKAARRGMERGHQIKRDYYGAAYDETRAKMLSEVAAQWEDVSAGNETDTSKLPDLEEGVLLNTRNTEDTELKLRGMMVQQVSLNQVNLEEAIDYLRNLSMQADNFELDPERKGLNIMIDLGDGESEVAQKILRRRFDLSLKNVPFEVVLDHVTKATSTTFAVEQYAVIVRPTGVDTGAMLTKRYQVPPSFLSSEAVNRQNPGLGADPFGNDTGNEDVLVKRLSPTEFLKKSGVSFPEGAYASYLPNGSILTVHNTRGNLALVETLIEILTDDEPVQIMIRVTVIDVLENRLKELGFDWLLADISPSSGLSLGGGTQGSAGGLGAVPLAAAGLSPVTLGNRGGAQSNVPNAIDSLFDRARPTVDSTNVFSDSRENVIGGTGVQADPIQGAVLNRAPGILSMRGFVGQQAYQAIMRGMNQKKGVDLMVRPEILTRPGQTVSIENTREMIYPTEYEPPEITSQVGDIWVDFVGESVTGFSPSITPAHPTAFETAKLGIVLEMEPNLDRNNNVINLTLKPAIKEFQGFINYGTPYSSVAQVPYTGDPEFPVISNSGFFPPDVPDPPGNPFGAAWIAHSFSAKQNNDILMPIFKTTKLDTNVNVYNGATVVIGGLLKQDTLTIRDRTPVLGSLPYLGRFFRSEQDVPVRRAIIILVNAEILDPSGRRVEN